MKASERDRPAPNLVMIYILGSVAVTLALLGVLAVSLILSFLQF